MTSHAAVPVRALLAVGFLAACGGSAAPSAEPADLAIIGAQLIDGTGGDPVADSVILIDDGRVRAAGPSDAVDVPDGTEVVDATGKTVIPGFVDLHAHYGGPVEATEQALRVAALLRGDDDSQRRCGRSREGGPHAGGARRTPGPAAGVHGRARFLLSGRLQLRLHEHADDGGRGARDGARAGGARRPLHEDVDQRGRGAEPQDPARRSGPRSSTSRTGTGSFPLPTSTRRRTVSSSSRSA